MWLQRFVIVRAIVCTMMCATPLWAQVNSTGTISGQVTDPAGAAVPSASVKVTDQNTGVSESITTGADGY